MTATPLHPADCINILQNCRWRFSQIVNCIDIAEHKLLKAWAEDGKASIEKLLPDPPDPLPDRVMLAVGALRPFADLAEKYGETWADQMTARDSGLKVGDVRRARTALRALTSTQETKT